MSESHGYLEGVGRVRLHYRAWEPPAPRAALLVVHGLSDHAERYAAFARGLNAVGIACFALDLRGHGASQGRRGHARRFAVFLQDLDRFRREVQGLVDPRCPLFLLGHSMGGLIALRYLQEYESGIGGAILISPWLATAVPVPRWKVLAANALNKLLPALPLRARIRSDHLSRDPAVCDAYRDDPLVHDTITPRLFTEVAHAMGLALHRGDNLRVPLLFLIAGNDLLVDAQRAQHFARSLPSHLVTTRVYPEAYHELLNEVNRREVVMEIREWLEARLAEPPARQPAGQRRGA